MTKEIMAYLQQARKEFLEVVPVLSSTHYLHYEVGTELFLTFVEAKLKDKKMTKEKIYG